MTINGLITCGRKKEEENPQNIYDNSSKDGRSSLFLKLHQKKKKTPRNQLKKEMLWTLQVYLLQNIYLESTLQEKFCVDINQYECVHQTSNLHQGIQTTESLPKHKCSREQIASNKLLQRK